MTHRVVVKPSGVEVVVSEGQTILEAALAAGIDWPYGCSHGMCGACKARLLSGHVDMAETSSFALFDDEVAAGFILTCSARPTSDLELTFD
jgi:ferredoxin